MSDAAGTDQLELLLIDGDNLLHRVRGSRDEGGVAWLLPRLRAWRPEHLRIVVALDGHSAAGSTGRQRVSPGIEIQHAGSRSADDLIIDRLAEQPWASRIGTAVVSGDRGLQARARRAGAITRTPDWLVAHLGGTRPGGGPDRPTGIGAGAPPPRSAEHTGGQEDEGRSWTPGRGATRKSGNPRRASKRTRQR